MPLISLNDDFLKGFVDIADVKPLWEQTNQIIDELEKDISVGFIDLPINYDRVEFARIKECAYKIAQDSDYLVCIGIGGSYLGHKAVIEAMGNTSRPKILYAGHCISDFELNRVLHKIKGKDWSINVISKSGTTTEPAIAFRILKAKLIEQYGEEEAYKRIYATTDANVGALHDEAVKNGYEMFVVPDNIGGRYSVLTAVGLLPIASAGIDIDIIMNGAAIQREIELGGKSLAARYAIIRNILYKQNFNIEVLAAFEPRLMYMNEWWKQLAGESEGKDGKGIFPASVINTTDLHSVGQYIQDGRRNLFETIVRFKPLEQQHSPSLVEDPENTDGLNYLVGKSLSFINNKAIDATAAAHYAGGVPVIQLEVDAPINKESLGALIYFFEFSIAVSGKLLGVNPFNQPGVEEYKNNMFKLLGKPGY